MNSKQIDAFETAAKKMLETGGGQFISFYNEDFSKVILELTAELRQTRSERDWLVRTIGDLGVRECPPFRSRWSTECCKVTCEECWLDAAKEATSCQK